MLRRLLQNPYFFSNKIYSLVSYNEKKGDLNLKTYLMIWFNSEGTEPQKVVQNLQEIGFKPIRGPYDHVYEWEEELELEEIIQLGNTVHKKLKGLKVLYRIETA